MNNILNVKQMLNVKEKRKKSKFVHVPRVRNPRVRFRFVPRLTEIENVCLPAVPRGWPDFRLCGPTFGVAGTFYIMIPVLMGCGMGSRSSHISGSWGDNLAISRFKPMRLSNPLTSTCLVLPRPFRHRAPRIKCQVVREKMYIFFRESNAKW